LSRISAFEENAKLNQFIFNGYINPEDAQITTRITKSGLLKSIKIIFLPDEKKSIIGQMKHTIFHSVDHKMRLHYQYQKQGRGQE
jgi:hypothetical protein